MSIGQYHHAVLQYLLAVRLASDEQLSEFHRQVLHVLQVPPNDANAPLEMIIAALNAQLDPCGLHIASILDDEVVAVQRDDDDDDDGDNNAAASSVASALKRAPLRVTKYYSVINKRADESAKSGTELKAKELSYFRELVDILVKDVSLSLVGALNAADAVDSFSKSQAEATLAHLTAERWLHRSDTGDFFLGVRSALELVPYIEQRFGEDALQKCTICHNSILSGIACSTPKCTVRLHNHCALTWLAAKDKSVCLTCQAPWSDAVVPKHVRTEVEKVRRERVQRHVAFNGIRL
jgi:hypothetical protein